MGSAGLNRARDKMRDASVDDVAIETFAHYYRLLEHGETGMIPESSIDPVEMESLASVDVSPEDAAAAIRTTAVIKLNGGLGTSMGMDRAKSLLCVRRRHHLGQRTPSAGRQQLVARRQFGGRLHAAHGGSLRS